MLSSLLPLALGLLGLPGLVGTARAGELVIESTVAAEVRHGDLRIAHTYGPGQVRVPDLEAGEQTFVVFRDGRPQQIVLRIPEEGEAWLRIGATGISGDHDPAAAAASNAPGAPVEGPAPRVEIRAASGDGFSVIRGEELLGRVTPEAPLVLEGLGSGVHGLQLRSLDRTIIWARGQLELQPGDRIVLHAREGRTVEAFGRAGAWQDDK